MCEIQQPFAPVAAASALWAGPVGLGPEARAALAATESATAPGAFAVTAPGPGPSLGGVNRDPDADRSVWLDPRRTRLAAPPMPDLPRPTPPTQFAVQGPVALEALLLTLPPLHAPPCTWCTCGGALGCAWVGGNLAPYSIAALMLTKRNGVRVQRALQAAGVVACDAALRALPADAFPCLCATLGGDRDLVNALVAFATANGGDTSALKQPRPADTVLYLNSVFVNDTLVRAREAVNAAARANYARAEGNRAYVTPRPLPPSSLTECPLVAAAETSAALVTRALTDPASNPTRRAELACLTGIPFNC